MLPGHKVILSVPLRMALIREIEDELGPLPVLRARLTGGTWSVCELTAFVHILCAAAGRSEDYDALGNHMLAQGLDVWRQAVLVFLNRVL